jgi:2-polyprenyl-3-methyl-5-hydroxy-6-metoxy-1,4-benzoquinol methylase
VLDIACGEGYVGNLLAIRARSVTGVDISLEAIKTVSPSVALTDGFTYFGCRILA